MGLSIAVGMLADLQLNDPDSVADFQAEFESINVILREHGLPPHEEPLEAEEWTDPLEIGGFPYSWIHYLRRLQAYQLAGKTAPALKADEDPTNDSIFNHPKVQTSHLINHSDAEGFYLPVDFRDVILDDSIIGEAIGSSQRLLAELRALAPTLGFATTGDEIPAAQVESVQDLLGNEGPLFREKAVWIVLFSAAAASVRNKAAIYFC